MCSVLSVMSDSATHGLQHVTLPCPSLSPTVCWSSCPSSQWCHPTISSSAALSPSALNLSQPQGHISHCMHACMVSRFSCVWLFATLWIITHQAPLSKGFSRQECWSGLPCPPPGGLPDPGIKPKSLVSAALQADSLPTKSLGKPVSHIETPDYRTRW